MKWTPEKRLGATALGLLALDQLTKWIVVQQLPLGREVNVLPGFFKFVHWGNTGAAWSLFHGNNQVLAAVSAIALIVLYRARRYFEGDTVPGQVALGLIIGGIAGNLIDRLARGHVVDFLYFHLHRRDGVELGFPAFNVADTAICTGVGIILLISWLVRPATKAEDAPTGSRKDKPSAELSARR
jgi:signal peptidase II